jgi:hypothetical protein
MITMLVQLIGAIAKRDVNILKYLVMTMMNVLQIVAIHLMDATIHLFLTMITTLVPKMVVIVQLDLTTKR